MTDERVRYYAEEFARLRGELDELNPETKYRREYEERLREMIREEIAIALGNKPKHRDDPTFDPRYDYEYYPEDGRKANEEWLRALDGGDSE